MDLIKTNTSPPQISIILPLCVRVFAFTALVWLYCEFYHICSFLKFWHFQFSFCPQWVCFINLSLCIASLTLIRLSYYQLPNSRFFYQFLFSYFLVSIFLSLFLVRKRLFQSSWKMRQADLGYLLMRFKLPLSRQAFQAISHCVW